MPQKLKDFTREKMREEFAELLPDYTVTAIDTPDPYGAALQVAYELVLGAEANVDGYISRSVLIETGARSAREPTDQSKIVPYIQDSRR